jgi:hypothetical protein
MIFCLLAANERTVVFISSSLSLKSKPLAEIFARNPSQFLYRLLHNAGGKHDRRFAAISAIDQLAVMRNEAGGPQKDHSKLL